MAHGCSTPSCRDDSRVSAHRRQPDSRVVPSSEMGTSIGHLPGRGVRRPSGRILARQGGLAMSSPGLGAGRVLRPAKSRGLPGCRCARSLVPSRWAERDRWTADSLRTPRPSDWSRRCDADVVREVVPDHRPSLFAAVRTAPREPRVPLAASTASTACCSWPSPLAVARLREHHGRADSLEAAPRAARLPGATGPRRWRWRWWSATTEAASADRPQGDSRLSSPVPPPRPAPSVTAQVEPPKPVRLPIPDPPVQAPVASRPADTETRPGVLEETTARPLEWSWGRRGRRHR